VRGEGRDAIEDIESLPIPKDEKTTLVRVSAIAEVVDQARNRFP